MTRACSCLRVTAHTKEQRRARRASGKEAATDHDVIHYSVYEWFGGFFCSSTPLLGSKTRVVSGSRYACRRPVLKLKIKTLGLYIA